MLHNVSQYSTCIHVCIKCEKCAKLQKYTWLMTKSLIFSAVLVEILYKRYVNFFQFNEPKWSETSMLNYMSNNIFHVKILAKSHKTRSLHTSHHKMKVNTKPIKYCEYTFIFFLRVLQLMVKILHFPLPFQLDFLQSKECRESRNIFWNKLLNINFYSI